MIGVSDGFGPIDQKNSAIVQWYDDATFLVSIVLDIRVAKTLDHNYSFRRMSGNGCTVMFLKAFSFSHEYAGIMKGYFHKNAKTRG